MSASADSTGRGRGSEARPTGLIMIEEEEKNQPNYPDQATVLQPLACKADECEML